MDEEDNQIRRRRPPLLAGQNNGVNVRPAGDAGNAQNRRHQNNGGPNNAPNNRRPQNNPGNNNNMARIAGNRNMNPNNAAPGPNQGNQGNRRNHVQNDQRPNGEPNVYHRRNPNNPAAGPNQANQGNRRNHTGNDRRDAVNFRNQNHNRNRQHQDNNGSSDEDDDKQKNKTRPMGFRLLQEIANTDTADILPKLNGKANSFQALLDSDIDKNDMLVLIIKVIAKVCRSPFEELKLNVLLNVCNSKYIARLSGYLMDLPYTAAGNKRTNSVYWTTPNDFWDNFICFCECIILRSPSTALQRCRALIDGASRVCLDGLKMRANFQLSPESDAKLNELREKLVICEKEEEKKVKRRVTVQAGQNEQPPDDFRELSILPTRGDLLHGHPFLRPNIVEGRYDSQDHYLDVQFRLLREDCIGPVRAGIIQYIQDPRKNRYDNIRVHKGVQFVEPYVSKEKVGVIIGFDAYTVKKMKKMQWEHSKRFMFGSLLLFTKDDFQTVTVATILDRDLKLLAQGKIPVSIFGCDAASGFSTNDSYVMIESEVYFEPYYHVLRALQDPEFINDDNIAMQKYIVEVDIHPAVPAYLTQEFTVKMDLAPGYPKRKIRVLHDEDWPTCKELGLNESQLEAYKLALTHEFALIQGPPGTGKTFLGVKVAKTMIENFEKIKLLLICFTNHALDQFLEAISNVTDSIVRVGGQSKCESLDKYNLSKLRGGMRLSRDINNLFFEKKIALQRTVTQLKILQDMLYQINNGVLKYKVVKEITEESSILEQFYGRSGKDPLKEWLFEETDLNADLDIYFDAEVEANEEYQEIDVDDDPNRMQLTLDDLNFVELTDVDDIDMSSFTYKEAVTELQHTMSQLKKPNNVNIANKLNRRVNDLKMEIKRYKDLSVHIHNNALNINITSRDHPGQFTVEERWQIYYKWARKLADSAKEKMVPLQVLQKNAYTAYEESRMIMDLKVLKKAKVFGMTTTGAAKNRKLLQSLAPNIVIVEEAAEVLESHIITALTRHCQHLILIGDHQQLRPSCANYRLEREFNMGVSLFERMVRNGVPSAQLTVQHRMRPEIAALVAPAIYPRLRNHESVAAFPQVRGLSHNLFFLTHNYKETAIEEDSGKCNEAEADLTLSLANYLMQQDYAPEDVTILATYNGQMKYMRIQRPKYAFLSKVKITVVDNYQGEESKIILLSLVRNNDGNSIGFLSTVNRVCVALSRAKEGFYILGNFDILKRNAEIWAQIGTVLERQGSLGSTLFLKCENHPGQITEVSSAEDFQKVPEGGCLLKCSARLPCGHDCPLICHGYDRGHTQIKCPRMCDRIICELGHTCPLKCIAECRPCVVPVEKKLPCGHLMMIPCHQQPTDPAVQCRTRVKVTLPDCNHEATKSCYKPVEAVKCEVPCVYRVDPCGHQCRLKCHVRDDPNHERYLCEKPCARLNAGCTGDHQCKLRCHEPCGVCIVKVAKKRPTCKHAVTVECSVAEADLPPCGQKCARSLSCGHFCKLKCSEPCGDCRVKVEKTIPDCGHKLTLECKDAATQDKCRAPCARKLPCGHDCRRRCQQPCDQRTCTQLVDRPKVMAPCGHAVRLPCNRYQLFVEGALDADDLLSHCAAPCGVTLACGHRCRGDCGACLQRRVHAPCTQPCMKTIICGHLCKEPCNQVCPPCRQRCEVACAHTKCNKTCGSPCTPCTENCTRRCVHGACDRKCGEPCSRPPCDQPCPKKLPCEHPCRGLCGEPCPDICKTCRPEEFPTDFLGEDFEDGAKFVKLQDCTHILEVEDFDNLMKGDESSITIRSCPFCRKAIINTHRYKDLVNAAYKNDINPVKEKIYGTKEQIELKKKEILGITFQFPNLHSTIMEDSNVKDWALAFTKVSLEIGQINKRQANISLPQLQMFSIYLDVLDMLSESYTKFMDIGMTSKNLSSAFYYQTNLICVVLMKNTDKITQQHQQDIGNEMKRINGIIQLNKITVNGAYAAKNNQPKVRSAYDAALSAIVSKTRIYDENTAHECLTALQKAVNLSGIITKEERELIVKAVGLKSGHWFKCPNGHIYCIGECGGAMETSKCNECGALIGGSQHTLLADNELAEEMDGARHPAWSNFNNDMRNFEL
ncbi:NFX1-type zinc finger-containing protein 1 isoform X3 [Plutella xylostella]|uniref:NFX1-type zinc finger-containing protein 1 isoform X3 n=1 Tax=Plutella xylostella TaxID=51655 RepID=UPI002032BBD4|nr:NFX1-type zinc finger-containing protein 1 isoform X3 [Plutella xylostella]